MNKNGYIIYEWLRSLPFAKECRKREAIYFMTVLCRASIHIYDTRYMELSIKAKDGGQQLFYQQFEIQDMKETRKLLSVFFYVLGNPEILMHHRNDWVRRASGARQEENSLTLFGARLAENLPENLRILISCTSGASSSVLAKKMNKVFEAAGCQVQADAVSVMELENVQGQYDLVLLSPQIGYRYQDLTEKYGSKIRQINTLDFATFNVGHILEQIDA